jgi:preprotein translocase subunit SecG
MIEKLLTIVSLFSILIISLRIPQKDTNGQNFEISVSLLGSPKNTDETLQNLTWFLCITFIILNCWEATQKL